MRPILTTLQLGEAAVPIGGFGAMVALALVVGAALALRSAARAELEAGGFIASLAAAVGCGFVGAALLFAGVEWLRTGGLPAAPGLVFYGGAVTGALGFAACARLHGLPPSAALAALLPALPIAHAIGRIGCFLGGCCFGASWDGPWAVVYSDVLAPAAHPSVPRHPWPLYEAFALLGLAWWIARSRASDRCARYVLAYAAVRFALEPLRGDAVRGVSVLSTSQWISLALFAAAAVLLAWPRLCAWQLRVYKTRP